MADTKTDKAARKRTARNEKRQLKKALPLLHAICRMSEVERRSLLQFLNYRGRDILYQCISNCVYNTRVPTDERRAIRSKLKSKSKYYKYLANTKNKDEKKKKILRTQIGGGLDTVLNTVLPILDAVAV